MCRQSWTFCILYYSLNILGRVHSAMISGINKELNSVMVEWYENGEAKGKEVIFSYITQFMHLVKDCNFCY